MANYIYRNNLYALVALFITHIAMRLAIMSAWWSSEVFRLRKMCTTLWFQLIRRPPRQEEIIRQTTRTLARDVGVRCPRVQCDEENEQFRSWRWYIFESWHTLRRYVFWYKQYTRVLRITYKWENKNLKIKITTRPFSWAYRRLSLPVT